MSRQTLKPNENRQTSPAGMCPLVTLQLPIFVQQRYKQSDFQPHSQVPSILGPSQSSRMLQFNKRKSENNRYCIVQV